MPLYEYQCETCHHRFEVIQKFSDPPVESCPICGSPVRKLLSSPAIQFKGSGWYITDYARKSGDGGGEKKPDAAKAEGKPAAESKSGESAGGSETKSTDAKSGAKSGDAS
jgi:putative FmdB family regulatory protein